MADTQRTRVPTEAHANPTREPVSIGDTLPEVLAEIQRRRAE